MSSTNEKMATTLLYSNNSSYLCINIVSQTMSRNITPRMSSAELRPPRESPGLVFNNEERNMEGYTGI